MDILIAEDEFISRNMLQKMLEMGGHKVLVVEDGLQAWKLFQKNDVKMVITDWIMPQMDGLELCKKIRSAGKKNYTYVIVLTAKDQQEDLIKVFNSGADDYISKPVDHEELKARIKTGERVIQLEEEHKRINDILKNAERDWRNSFNSLEDIMIIIDRDYNIEMINDSGLVLLGKSKEEVIGEKCYQIMHGKNSPEEHCPFRESLKTKKPSSIEIYEDLFGKHFSVKSSPIFDENGEIIKFVDLIRDITKNKRAEDVLTKNKEKLEQALKELKNTQAQIVQSEKMASIGQLAAGVAHEINNPSGFVSSNLKTLMDYQNDLNQLIKEYRKLVTDLKDTIADNNLSPALSKQIAQIATLETEVDIDFVQEDIQDLIQDCREGTERIKKIVIDLKDFAHPGEDKLQFADINSGMESTLNVVNNELKYKARLIKDFGVLPDVKCYPQQLNQVFMNILVNAVQAIEKQGEINIKTRHVDGHVEIAISDTGSGISEENLNKIFDPFFTTKDVGKGTGLGMNIAYNIINKHNGTIDVESKVGEGTTFMIRIPAE